MMYIKEHIFFLSVYKKHRARHVERESTNINFLPYLDSKPREIQLKVSVHKLYLYF